MGLTRFHRVPCIPPKSHALEHHFIIILSIKKQCPLGGGPPLFSVSTNASLVAMRPATLARGLAKIDQVPSGYVKIAIENGQL